MALRRTFPHGGWGIPSYDQVVSALYRGSEAHPDRVALIHLDDGVNESVRLSYADLLERVCRLAASLQARALAGRPVVVATPAGPDYAITMLGCFFAGAIAIPMPEIIPGRPNARWNGMLRQLSPGAIIASEKARSAAHQLSDIPWLTLDDPTPPASDWTAPALSDSSPAFVQFTSGSTGAPKGAIITHGALAANRAMLRQACELEPAVCSVTWLPPWHDMGLVGGLLHHLADGLTVVTIPPLVAIQRPIRWLRAIQTYGGTISGGPPSAFRNCIDRTTIDERAGLDLRSWQLAFCGAEPIAATVLHDFAATFGPHGFDRNAFAPCYGLAEATLFATGITRGEIRIIEADRTRLDQDGVVVPARGGRALVSCGHGQGDGRIEILEPDSGEPLPEGQVGEIALSGPHLADGYWNPDQNAGTFETLASGRRLRTGDLGAMIDGALFVTGRLNHRIIAHGRKHHPEDIESEATIAHPALAGSTGVVFALDGEDRERTVIVLEVARMQTIELPVAEVQAAVRSRVAKQCGLRLDEVILVRTGTLLRTTSGKIERHSCRAHYAAGNWPAKPLLAQAGSTIR